LTPSASQNTTESTHTEFKRGTFEGRTILVVEDDVRNVFALSSV